MAYLPGYVAFSAERAQNVEDAGKLTPCMFGQPFKWIPFSDTREDAIDKALTSAQSPPEAATSITEWYILRVGMRADACVHAFLEEKIERKGPYTFAGPGWRYKGELRLGGEDGLQFQWSQSSVEPLGIEQWAKKALGSHCKVRHETRCDECGADGVSAWAATKQYDNAFYCARCWNAFYSQQGES